MGFTLVHSNNKSITPGNIQRIHNTEEDVTVSCNFINRHYQVSNIRVMRINKLGSFGKSPRP